MEDRTPELLALLLKTLGLALTPAWALAISPSLFWFILITEIGMGAAFVCYFRRLPWSLRHPALAVPLAFLFGVGLFGVFNFTINIMALALVGRPD